MIGCPAKARKASPADLARTSLAGSSNDTVSSGSAAERRCHLRRRVFPGLGRSAEVFWLSGCLGRDVQSCLVDGERVGPVVAVPQPVRPDAHVHDVGVLRALLPVGVLIDVRR